MPTTEGTDAPFISPATPDLCARRRGPCVSAETLRTRRFITPHQISNMQRNPRAIEKRTSTGYDGAESLPRNRPGQRRRRGGLPGRRSPDVHLDRGGSRRRGQWSGRDTGQAHSCRLLAEEEDGEQNRRDQIESTNFDWKSDEWFSWSLIRICRIWERRLLRCCLHPLQQQRGSSGRSPVAFHREANTWRRRPGWTTTHVTRESQSMYSVLYDFFFLFSGCDAPNKDFMHMGC